LTKTTSSEIIEWVALSRRTNDPKLMWIEAQLEISGVPSRRSGYSWHAPILEIPIDAFHAGMAILSQRVGQLDLGTSTAIVIDDIDDEHPYFMEWAMATGRAFAPRESREALAPLAVTDSTFAGLSYEDVNIPEIADPVRMVDVDSRMLSAIGKLDPYGDWASEPPLTTGRRGKQNYLFARFKGSAEFYRYENTTLAQFLELLRRQRSGESLGTYFDATFKKHPFLYPYEKWDEVVGRWVTIAPKAKGARKGSKRAQVTTTELAPEIVEHANAPVEEFPTGPETEQDNFNLSEGQPGEDYDDAF
jgi:hypothetical protein